MAPQSGGPQQAQEAQVSGRVWFWSPALFLPLIIEAFRPGLAELIDYHSFVYLCGSQNAQFRDDLHRVSTSGGEVEQMLLQRAGWTRGWRWQDYVCGANAVDTACAPGSEQLVTQIVNEPPSNMCLVFNGQLHTLRLTWTSKATISKYLAQTAAMTGSHRTGPPHHMILDGIATHCS